MTATILVVDDQASVRTLLRDYLTQQGFRVVVAADGEQAIYTARHEHPKLILLDIMMPNMDGYQFLRQFRKESTIPVIVITARDDETDAVLGLDLGADNSLIKPFRMRELPARAHAMLRRPEPAETEKFERLDFGTLQLDTRTHDVQVNGKSIALTPIEFDLLATLMRSPGRVYSRTELVDHLTDSGFAGLENTLNVHVRNLRTKIEPDPPNPVYIETVFGVGYRFNREAPA